MSKPRGVGKRFEKGQSGNPLGKPKKDPIISQFQETTYKEFIGALQTFSKQNIQEIKEHLVHPETMALEGIFCRIVVDAYEGKKDARDVLFDRLFGKVKEQIVHSSENLSVPQIIVQLPAKQVLEE